MLLPTVLTIMCLVLLMPVSTVARPAPVGLDSYGGGRVGVVKGICVSIVGGVGEFGEVFPLSVKITPGKGTVTLNAEDVDSDFIRSLTNSRKYLMNYVARSGYRYDWMKTNIDIHLQESSYLGGDSAGVALATALLSAAMRLPIRDDVVITGAIKPDGSITEVGGVSIKASAAFRNPNIRTIIVPRTSENVAEVLVLPAQLLAGRRLIASRDMSQVLRQALIGYDKPATDRAALLFKQGLAFYGSGRPDDAVSRLKEAMKLTPEDLTLPIWIRTIQSSGIPTHSPVPGR